MSVARRRTSRKRAAGPETVGGLVQRLLPAGTVTGGKEWGTFPRWPPDLFAVAASIVQASGAYARAMPAEQKDDRPFGRAFTERVTRWGEVWRLGGSQALDRYLARLWRTLIGGWERALYCRGRVPVWAAAALELMAVADEASAGVGRSGPPKEHPFAWLYLELHWSAYVRNREVRAGHTTVPRAQTSVTACIEVPPTAACVQPKTRSPRVGCTMRSLSRHLALLPSVAEIRTSWHMVPAAPQDGLEPLNLLLVPYPYRIPGNSFTGVADARGWGLFDVRQTWLPSREPAATLARFLRALLREARVEVGEVDGIILPELALPRAVALDVAARLAGEDGLEFFISGTAVPGPVPRNEVLTCVMRDRDLIYWEQSKHHRWKLDASQIATYSLGHVLDSRTSWWENAAVGDREVRFFQVRNGAALSVLVCEDLARIDPVQTAVRSVGPNLVIVLLMDGAQTRERWPARYATVLAEDPGSSVLTLTSLGMVMRGFDRVERPSRSVALWRDPASRPRQLELEPGAHALLVTLSATARQERTMDGRMESGEGTVQYSLSGVRNVRVTDAALAARVFDA